MESVRSDVSATTSQVVAIGVGVAGLVDFHRGIIVHTPNMALSAGSVICRRGTGRFSAGNSSSSAPS